jgi:G3E family GTPase
VNEAGWREPSTTDRHFRVARRPLGSRSVRSETFVPPDDVLRLHLITGFPSPANARAIERIVEHVRLFRLGDAAIRTIERGGNVAILLPPHVEPGRVVDGWSDEAFLSRWLCRSARLVRVVTLLDTAGLERDLFARDLLRDRGWQSGPFDGRSVADLLAEQIEGATTIWRTSAAVDGGRLDRALDGLNPRARRVDDVDAVAARFAIEDPLEPSAGIEPDWVRALRGDGDTPETCLVYRRAEPFDPGRFADWLERPPADVVRGKGSLWFDSRWDRRVGYSCAGAVHRTFEGGTWWASAPAGRWPECAELRRRLLETWHPRFGDRCQHLVLVGADLDRRAIVASLDRCLVHGAGAPRPADLAPLH